MLSKIKLKNFKLFKEESPFNLSSINLFTGVNGRGKSTLIQAIVLMKQSVAHNPMTSNLILNDRYLSLGTFDDIRNSSTSPSETIGFNFVFDNSENTQPNTAKELDYKFSRSSLSNLVCDITQLRFKSEFFSFTATRRESFEHFYINDVLFKSDGARNVSHFRDSQMYLLNNLFLEGVFIPQSNDSSYLPNFFGRTHFLAADRIGPQKYYEKGLLEKFPNVGSKGELTATVLADKGQEPVNTILYLGNDANEIIQQTEEWMRVIFNGAKIQLRGKDPESSVLDILFNTSLTEKRYKPANVGFGFTYILPIIVTGLLAQPGEILIVENPEAHLHPRAQAELTRFLTKVASTGVQVFIESHSEHILNALRISVVREDIHISGEDISIIYFDDLGYAKIKINNEGAIDNWPDGFFDQTDKDFRLLFGI